VGTLGAQHHDAHRGVSNTDIVAFAIGLFIALFMLELSFNAGTSSASRFWAFLCMVMMMLIAAQTAVDGNITIGTDTIALDTMLDVGLVILILVPVMKILDTRNTPTPGK
jgi:hypothetical protein